MSELQSYINTVHTTCFCCAVLCCSFFFLLSSRYTVVQIFNKLRCICERYQFHFHDRVVRQATERLRPSVHGKIGRAKEKEKDKKNAFALTTTQNLKWEKKNLFNCQWCLSKVIRISMLMGMNIAATEHLTRVTWRNKKEQQKHTTAEKMWCCDFSTSDFLNLKKNWFDLCSHRDIARWIRDFSTHWNISITHLKCNVFPMRSYHSHIFRTILDINRRTAMDKWVNWKREKKTIRNRNAFNVAPDHRRIYLLCSIKKHFVPLTKTTRYY